MIDRLKDFASGGRPWNPANLAQRQVMAVNIFTGVGIVILSIFAIVHYFFDEPMLALILGAIAGIGVGNLFWLRRTENGAVASTVTLVCLGIVLLAILIHGGIDATGPFWLGIFPAVAFFFKGRRNGMVWVIGLFLCLVVLIVAQLIGHPVTPFSTISLFFLLTAVMTLSTLVYAYELLRSSAEETSRIQSSELLQVNSQLTDEARERQAAEAALRVSDAKLRYLAHHDLLTDLPNRNLLTEQLTLLLENSKRYGDRGFVMFVDLDGFKRVNDRLGHLLGDELLRLAAFRLRHVLRRADFVSRYGGDEFVILLSKATDTDIVRTAQRLVRKMSTPFDVQGHQCRIGSSIGIARFPEHGTDLDAVMKCADAAMYRAKSAGGNCWAFYAEVDCEERASDIEM